MNARDESEKDSVDEEDDDEEKDVNDKEMAEKYYFIPFNLKFYICLYILYVLFFFSS